jgi:hypothetical protein
MTKRKLPPPNTNVSPQQSSFDIAINILLRCEHLLRSLAFQCRGDASTPAEESLKKMQKLCSDFHETLFIIDHALHKYRVEHKLNDDQAHAYTQDNTRDQAKYEEDKDPNANAYRLLSEITEQLTDYAFLIGHRVHPWDVPYAFEESTAAVATTTPHATTPASTKYAQQIKFPPAAWKNRVLRQSTTPLAGFPLENSLRNDNNDSLDFVQ